MANDEKYIWIFGENLGSTADNNSYFFWKQVVNRDDEIDKYFVLEKNSKTKKIYEQLSKNEKKYILWKNSRKHYQKYFDADLFFVTLSYKDVVPERLTSNEQFSLNKPIIYLQHGTIGMKYVGYTGGSYWNNMFRFFTYNPKENDYLIDRNDFKDYQLYFAQYPPRYIELYKKSKNTKKQILWFITWREYFEDNPETLEFKKNIIEIIKNQSLRKYLKDNGITLKLCVHQFFDGNIFKDIYDGAEENVIDIVKQQEIDIMQELAESEVLITDYSSVAYDFTFLEKPVILFQPDLEAYMEKREFYCEKEELDEHNIIHSYDLVKTIVTESYGINPFFRKAYPDEIDYSQIEQGKHIEKMYSDLKDIQMNKVTFIGYNLNEVTNDVNYIMSLSEGLLEEGYLVELISLIRPHPSKQKKPYALNIRNIWDFEENLSIKLLRRKNKYRKSKYLKYEDGDKYLKNYVEYKLNEILKNIRTNFIISTRESIHLVLNENDSNNIKNKIYLFNDSSEMDIENYSKIIQELKKINIQKAIFTSDDERLILKENFDYDNYDSYILLDSFITKNKSLDLINLDSNLLDDDENIINPYPEDSEEYELIEEYDSLKQYQSGLKRKYVQENDIVKEYATLKIAKTKEKKIYYGLCLSEINESNKEDLDKIIEYGLYLKENNIKNIIIDVYGRGNYEKEFLDLIEDHELFNIINYRGLCEDPIHDLRNHDFMISFSTKPIYIIDYIEGILNYKKVFCIKNPKTTEIMEGIPNTFIESYEWLCNEINNLDKISLKELRSNYIKISERYSNKKNIRKLIEYLDN